jgi:DNA-binding transcriptional ArsR family regulator
MRMKEMHDTFRMLGSPARLAIVNLLVRSSPLCVNSIARKLKMSQSAVSQHLRVLKMGGWVSQESRGYYRHYSLNRKKLERLSQSISKLATGEVSSSCSGSDRPGCAKPKGGDSDG